MAAQPERACISTPCGLGLCKVRGKKGQFAISWLLSCMPGCVAAYNLLQHTIKEATSAQYTRANRMGGSALTMEIRHMSCCTSRCTLLPIQKTGQQTWQQGATVLA
eukprot:573487-Pelagomonas_calceolata.AAC.5